MNFHNYILLFFLFFYNTITFSQNKPPSNLNNLNEWQEIPQIDNFGDVEGISHYQIANKCIGERCNREAIKHIVYFNVRTDAMGIFFYC